MKPYTLIGYAIILLQTAAAAYYAPPALGPWLGMTLGLLPVIGVALPFVSYGGSHMVSAMIAIGLLQSVNFRRYIY